MVSAPSRDPRRAEMASRFVVLVLAGIFLLGLLGFAVAVLDAEGAPASPRPTTPSGEATPVPQAAPRIRLALAAASVAPESGAAAPEGTALAPEGTPVAPESVPADEVASFVPEAAAPLVPSQVTMPVPVAPVTRFWSAREGLARRDIVRGLEQGRVPGFRGLIVEASLAEALATTLAIEIHEDVARGDMEAVRRAVRRGALGLVSASELEPSLRALNLDGRSLIGNGRIRDLADWPLTVTQELPDDQAWDPSRTWVLVAGGDAFTDRGVYDSVVRKGRGVDFPFDGGSVRVTAHACCDPVYGDNVVPRYVLSGGQGAVRRLFRDADLAIANHEMPTTDAWDFHTSGFTFSGRPDLTRVFTRAGLDWMSLANNHIKDYGTEGIVDTRRILRQHGLAFGGAGVDLEQARRISYLDVADTSVALIPCVGVAPAAWAGPATSGGTPCLDRYLVPDIKAAGRRADLVIIVPHWGVEYTRQPLPSMRRHASRWVKAGADLILGGHSHVAGAIEDIDGSPVLYSLGNLIFDQHWSTDTMESALVEATFQGGRLAALRLHPYLIHATSQPNLLDPAEGEGRRLLRQMRAASADWLDW